MSLIFKLLIQKYNKSFVRDAPLCCVAPQLKRYTNGKEVAMAGGFILKIGVIVLLLLLLISCTGNEIESLSSINACYQNSFGDDEFMDYEVLTITIAGTAVEGQFHWLPAFKDRRTGYFNGTKTRQVILAKYDYMQEGKKSSVEIQLILNDRSISVSGGEPALGLTSEIPQIDCEKLKEVPLAK